ncbi:MAG: GtrA family protein [Fibromonadales bacterium]|nr:GtrA family protein [Fibromonadales bacterium]
MIFDKKFFKFILVGIINTVVGSAIMFSLYNLAHLSYWVSSACNYFFGSILSFFLNKYFTFTVKEWSLFMIVAFILNIAISYFIAYGLAKPLINYFLDNESQNIRENVALFVGMCLFTGLNYLGQRFVVFNKR